MAFLFGLAYSASPLLFVLTFPFIHPPAQNFPLHLGACNRRATRKIGNRSARSAANSAQYWYFAFCFPPFAGILCGAKNSLAFVREAQPGSKRKRKLARKR